jgi:hypothetical protein
LRTIGENVSVPSAIMKTSNSKAVLQKLAGNVQMARRRVATAQSRWRTAKKQARAARRRRKAVKLLARRARKQAKQAKAILAEARKALAKAEAKLAKSGVRAVTMKPAKTKARPVAKRAVTAPKKKVATVRRRRKEVKPVARRARKQATLAKSGVRVTTRKPVRAKRRPIAKDVVTDRKIQTIASAPTSPPGTAAQVTPASLPEKASMPIPAQTDPGAFAPKTPVAPAADPEKAGP